MANGKWQLKVGFSLYFVVAAQGCVVKVVIIIISLNFIKSYNEYCIMNCRLTITIYYIIRMLTAQI